MKPHPPAGRLKIQNRVISCRRRSKTRVVEKSVSYQALEMADPSTPVGMTTYIFLERLWHKG